MALASVDGMMNAEPIPRITVAIPSKIKIHCHPARPPTPCIWVIAVAKRPGHLWLDARKADAGKSLFTYPRMPPKEMLDVKIAENSSAKRRSICVYLTQKKSLL